MHTEFQSENLKGDLGVETRIILKCLKEAGNEGVE
jgi:hypothetical protein